jgi:hypothetical protein
MRAIIAVVLFFGFTNAPFAQTLDSFAIATNLGSVIASEEVCGLTYNQDAIARYIEDNVPADDMGFASTLNLMTDGAGYQISSMSESAKTAHCAQTRRVAKSYGFVE